MEKKEYRDGIASVKITKADPIILERLRNAFPEWTKK
jgi:hypothetical protein